MSETGDVKSQNTIQSAVAGQSIYGWALVACIAVAGLFVVTVLTGKFDTAFERLRGGLANIGSEPTLEKPSDEVPQNTNIEPDISDDPALEAPTFDIVRVEPTGEAVMAGLSFPSSQIHIVLDSKVIAEAKANVSGEWALVLDQAFQPGGHALSIRTISPDGNLQIASEQQVTISVPEAPTESAIVMLDSAESPSAVWQSPAITLRPEVATEPDELLSLGIDEKTAGTNEDGSSADSGRLEDIVAPLITVETIEMETDGTLYALGASNPSAAVRVYFDDELVGETTTDNVGRWQLATQHLLPKDSYTVRVDRVETTSGTVLARRSVVFGDGLNLQISPPEITQSSIELDTDLNTQVADGTVSVQIEGGIETTEAVIVSKGDNLWSISRRLLGRGIRYTTLYNANEDQIADPFEVFPGQVFVVPDAKSSANPN